MKLNEINSNIIYLAPFFTAFYFKELAFMAISFLVFIISTSYHFVRGYDYEKRFVLILRSLDIFIAVYAYLYLTWYVNNYLKEFGLYIYSVMIVSVCVYFYGKTNRGGEKGVHKYFHLLTGLISLSILCLKVYS